MAYFALERHPGDGVTNTYTWDFPCMTQTDIHVFTEDTSTGEIRGQEFTFLSSNSLKTTVPTPVGQTLIIKRETPVDRLLEEGDKCTQTFYRLQETLDSIYDIKQDTQILDDIIVADVHLVQDAVSGTLEVFSKRINNPEFSAVTRSVLNVARGGPDGIAGLMLPADKDLVDSVGSTLIDHEERISALDKPFEALVPHDFEADEVSQEALTAYCMAQKGSLGAYKVLNTFNGSWWYYDLRVGLWIPSGASGAPIATESFPGIVRSSSYINAISVDPESGVMTVNRPDVTVTREEYEAETEHDPDKVYRVVDEDNHYRHYVGDLTLNLDEHVVEELHAPLEAEIAQVQDNVDAVNELLDNLVIVTKTTQELTRSIGGKTTIPVAMLPQNALIHPGALNVFDDNGTRAVLTEVSGTNAVFDTMSISSMPELDPRMLGTVANLAARPTSTTAFNPVAKLYDFIHIQQDSTYSNQTVRYYVKSISGTTITWGDPLVVNMGTYQAMTSSAMKGRILIGGDAGTFGPYMSVAGSILQNDSEAIPPSSVIYAFVNAYKPNAGQSTLGMISGGEGADGLSILLYNNRAIGKVNCYQTFRNELNTLNAVRLTPEWFANAKLAHNASVSNNPIMTQSGMKLVTDPLATRATNLETRATTIEGKIARPIRYFPTGTPGNWSGISSGGQSVGNNNMIYMEFISTGSPSDLTVTLDGFVVLTLGNIINATFYLDTFPNAVVNYTGTFNTAHFRGQPTKVVNT